MNPDRMRTSRTLVLILAVAVVVAVVLYARRDKKKPAATPAPAAQVTTPKPTPASTDNDANNAALVSTTPGGTSSTPAPTPSTPAATPGAPTTPATPPKPTMSSSDATGALGKGTSKMDAGDLVGARTVVNDALASGQLSEAEAASAKQMLAEINKTLVFSEKKFPDDPMGGTYTVKAGDRMTRIASDHDMTWEFLGRLNGISDPRKLKAGQTLKVIKGPFHAVVSKSHFTIDLYLGAPNEKGSVYVTTFPVGLGKDDSTPTGTWMVKDKLKNPTYYSPRGGGVVQPGDPKNPLGGYWIALAGMDGQAVDKTSYGIHGTIDPDSIGKQASLGCIRMKNEDVPLVYEMMIAGKSLVLVKP